MYEDFVRERISEYQMSYDLGHSRGYVYNISSGKALPPLKEFFVICDYYEISPQEFFNESSQNPKLIQKAGEGMKQLNESDLLMLLGFINRMRKQGRISPPLFSFLQHFPQLLKCPLFDPGNVAAADARDLGYLPLPFGAVVSQSVTQGQHLPLLLRQTGIQSPPQGCYRLPVGNLFQKVAVLRHHIHQ